MNEETFQRKLAELIAEQAHNSRSLAERRERDRGASRMYRSVIKHKRRRR